MFLAKRSNDLREAFNLIMGDLINTRHTIYLGTASTDELTRSMPDI
jgi:hypothetical protein